MATFLVPLLPIDNTTISENNFLLGAWSEIDSKVILTMTILAGIVIAGSFFAALAYQNGPPALVSTFDYSYLAFSALWGFAFFSEVPDGYTVCGMVMIVVAGITAIR